MKKPLDDPFAVKVQDWDSDARQKMVNRFVDHVRALNHLTPDSTLVEIGSGTGLVALSFESEVRHLLMIDTSASMIDALGKKVAVSTGRALKRVIHGDISCLDVDLRADMVLLFMTLHHIDSLPQFFTQLRSRMAVGGRVVIGDLYQEDGSFHGDERVPHNGFDPDQLVQLLEQYGFGDIHLRKLLDVRRHDRDYPLFTLSAKAI